MLLYAAGDRPSCDLRQIVNRDRLRGRVEACAARRFLNLAQRIQSIDETLTDHAGLAAADVGAFDHRCSSQRLITKFRKPSSTAYV